MREVHVVLEQVVVEQFDAGTGSAEKIITQADIGVADVLRGQRQVHATMTAIGHSARKKIVQHEECRLAAIADGDILLTQGPAELPVEKGRDLLAKLPVPLRRLVDAKQAVALDRVRHDVFQTLLENRLHLLQPAGITTTHEDHVGVFVQRLAEVGHQLDDAGMTSEFLAEG
jgi:hypothetical protein